MDSSVGLKRRQISLNFKYMAVTLAMDDFATVVHMNELNYQMRLYDYHCSLYDYHYKQYEHV